VVDFGAGIVFAMTSSRSGSAIGEIWHGARVVGATGIEVQVSRLLHFVQTNSVVSGGSGDLGMSSSETKSAEETDDTETAESERRSVGCAANDETLRDKVDVVDETESRGDDVTDVDADSNNDAQSSSSSGNFGNGLESEVSTSTGRQGGRRRRMIRCRWRCV